MHTLKSFWLKPTSWLWLWSQIGEIHFLCKCIELSIIYHIIVDLCFVWGLCLVRTAIYTSKFMSIVCVVWRRTIVYYTTLYICDLLSTITEDQIQNVVWWNALIHISDLTIKGNKVFVIVAYLPIFGMNIKCLLY